MKANIKVHKSQAKKDDVVYLSIGMIVKNESRYLRRCLAALTELLRETNGELIIVDTGSSDDTVEIAKEFTDKVYFYEWTGDFAAARNESLRRAVGKWFMFVDADEIFESTKGIAQFVTTDQPECLSLGAYNIRNLIRRDSNEYVDATLFRIHRMYPEIKFEHQIHENISVRPGSNALFLNDVLCIHYGYSDELSKAETKAKERRNTELLENALEKDPENTHYLLHYTREFKVIKSDYERQMEYIERGIKCSVGKDTHPAFLTGKILKLHLYEKYEEGKKAYLEFIEQHDDAIFSDIDCSYFTGMNAFIKQDYPTIIIAIQRYLKAYALFEKNAIATPDFAFNPQTKLSEINKAEAVAVLAYARYKEGDASDMKRFTELADHSVGIPREGRSVTIETFLNYCIEEEDFAQIPKLYRQIMDNDSLREFMEKRLSGMTNEEERRMNIAQLFCNAFKGDETKFIEMQFILCGKKDYKVLFAQDKEKNTSVAPDLLMMMLRQGDSLSEIVEYLPDLASLESCAAITAKRYDGFDRTVYEYVRTVGCPSELRQLFAFHALCLAANRIQMLEPQELHTLFVLYAEALHEEMKLMYQPTMFRPENMELLPPKYQFAYRMNAVKTSLADNDYIMAVRNLKSALFIQKEFVSDIEYYSGEVQKKQKESALTTEEKSEFEQLGTTLIAKAEELRSAGMIKEAKMIADQLAALLPNDKRVKKLLDELK